MTARILTAAGKRNYAIAKTKERRDAELAPLRAEVAAAIAEVGWTRARPVVETVLGPGVRVSGPSSRAAWWHKVGKRSGARILAELAALPVQQRFALSLLQPGRSVHETGETP
jgi:hypothetical protein